MVSTGIWKYELQVECLRKRQQTINANKVKNALATVFGGNQAVAFA